MSGNNFGEFLKDLRIRHGYKTQKQLAEVSGISQTTLSRIEAGNQRPQPETLRILAEHLRPYTFGQLMEQAGYFEGLNSSDRNFVVDLFDEEEDFELETNIRRVVDSISKEGKFNDNVIVFLKTELEPMFEAEGWTDVEFTPAEIKQLSKELNAEYKKYLFEGLVRASKITGAQNNKSVTDLLSDEKNSTIAAHHDGEDWTEEELEEIERFKQFVKMKRGPRAGE